MPRKTLSKSDAVALKAVGGKLRTIRREQRLTQKAFAQILDLSREGYANYELGKREMGILTALTIRQKTGVDPLELKSANIQPKPRRSSLRAAADRSPLSPFKRIQQFRARHAAAREAFDQDSFTAFGRGLLYARDTLYLGATISALSRFAFPELGRNIAPTEIDWSLLTSWALLLILLPFKIRYFIRFYLWARANQTPLNSTPCRQKA